MVYFESAGDQFFFISKVFDYIKDQNSLQALVDSFTTNYTELEHSSWLKYWQLEGNKLYQKTWYQKYPEYKFAEQTTEDTENWSELWSTHVLNVYNDWWPFFQSVFYNYHTEIKLSLEYTLNGEESYESDSNELETVDITKEFEQLKLLGLPTSFGSRGKSFNYSKHSQDASETEEGYNYGFLSDDISESDTDNEEDNMPNEKEDSNAESVLHKLHSKTTLKKKNKKLNRKLRKVPNFMLKDKQMLKYWRKRFSLFSLFDNGIRLDRESWFSVTPEKVAQHLAERLACDVIVDGFCGCGGNTIQFAKTCQKVIAIDIDPNKLAMAKHNARIYGVEQKIEFVLGDFLQICESLRLRADVVFLSPPWGGPNYKYKKNFDIERSLQPVGATKLIELSRKVSSNIALFLPRKSNMQQVIQLAGVGNKCEVVHNFLDTRLVAITAMYGGIISQATTYI